MRAASRLAVDQRRRSLVIWLTDVPDVAITPDVVTSASQLAVRHLVLFVMIGHQDLHRVASRRPEGSPLTDTERRKIFNGSARALYKL